MENYYTRYINTHYTDYLQSDHWKEFKKTVREFWNNRCCICSSAGDDVHHNNYNRLNCERPTDCVLLCRTCHEKFHDIRKKAAYDATDPQLRMLLSDLDKAKENLNVVIEHCYRQYEPEADHAGKELADYLSWLADFNELTPPKELFYQFHNMVSIIEMEVGRRIEKIKVFL